ncbi:MAG: type 1 glutamine amidotransferase [Burkholderia gladioli]
MKIHFVVHEAYEAPGAYETWVVTRGHTAAYSRVYLGEPLPKDIRSIDLLVVLGGPQSPSTTQAECPHFDAAAEQALILACAQAGKAVVGVCLGAQLMGEAFGAACIASPEKEIGKYPIALTPEGRANPRFARFGDTLEVGHWHNDMPGLTEKAVVVAASEGCPRQIIEYDRLVYGFQCHMEFTRSVVELLITAAGNEFEALTTRRFVQQPAQLRANDYDDMNDKLYGFLDALIEDYRVSLRSAA